MIERGADLPVKRQAQLLDLSRSSVYYTPRALPERDLLLMRRIDELHLKWPFYGSRKLTRELQNEGHDVGRRHVVTLMRRMGIEVIYRKPRTSIPARWSTIYPYLLGGLQIERANQVWAADLTYLPMAHGFQYLVAIIDLWSRKVLSWRVSNTMTPDFCVEALQEALERHGKPQIFNTDQGSQFTSSDWTDVLKAASVQISMDGKGRWIDNVFIERLWRSVKYENVYLHAYENGTQLRQGLAEYFEFYNATRTHQALDYQTPDQVYYALTLSSGGQHGRRSTNPRASDATRQAA
jgi:putative transposase